MDEIEEIIREVKIGLDEKGIPYKHIKTGIMIETPAAVMISRELARRVDFLSLGTNDQMCIRDSLQISTMSRKTVLLQALSVNLILSREP